MIIEQQKNNSVKTIIYNFFFLTTFFFFVFWKTFIPTRIPDVLETRDGDPDPQPVR